jgi:pimeloyl-ACP methyl ester carboxylesterase
LKLLRRLALGFLVLLLLSGGGLWIAGRGAQSSLSKQYPPLGQRIDIGGHRLHIYCLGEGAPAALFEAGLNEFSIQWMPVQREVAKFTRACAYDRAGLGWSEAGPAPRSGAAMVQELRALLDQGGVKGPLVLVGHSFGGLLARQYIRAHPEEVIGLVLVDATHEDYLERIPQVRPLLARAAEQFRSLAWMERIGLMALSPESIPARGLSGDALARYRAVLGTTGFFGAAAAETSAFEANLAAARATPLPPLGDLPLVVLTRGRADPLPGLSEADNRRFEEEWGKLQAELPRLSRRSRTVNATDSGHDIHLTQPELVVEAIRSVIMQGSASRTSVESRR